MEVKIKKATLNGRSLKVTYTQTQNTPMGEISDDVTVNCGALVHDDLLAVFGRLKVHFAILCDLREAIANEVYMPLDEYMQLVDFDNVYISGISLSGSMESESVEIMGGKTAKGRCINMTSPKSRRDSSYQYTEELFEAMEAVDFEIKEYLFNEKYAIKQMELDFDADYQSEGADMRAECEPDQAEPETETPKPRGRKKRDVIIPTAANGLAS